VKWPAEGCLFGAICAAVVPRRACQVSIEAINKHLAQTSGRMRRRQGLRPAALRRRRLVRFAASRRARQHRAPAASTLRAWANSVENDWDFATRVEDRRAWNALMAKSEVITSIGTRDWAKVKT